MNVLQPAERARIEAAIDQLYPQIVAAKLPLDSVELIVGATWKQGVPCIGYYIADWEKRSILWFEEVDQDMITSNERPPVSSPHLGTLYLSDYTDPARNTR